MGLRRFGALRMPARLDHHDRFGSCRRARRRHELARVFHQFDVEQDGAGVPIEREEVEKIAKVDIDLIAERDHGGKTDGPDRGPFDQPAAIAPDCEMSARSPLRGMLAAKLALSLA